MCIDLILMGMLQPVWCYAFQILFYFLADLKHITTSLIKGFQLVNDPLYGIFRKYRSREVCGRLITEYQGMGLDIDIHMGKGVGEGLCLANDIRFSFTFLKGLCIQKSTLRAYTGSAFLHDMAKRIDALPVNAGCCRCIK